jgi:hypothetical protein
VNDRFPAYETRREIYSDPYGGRGVLLLLTCQRCGAVIGEAKAFRMGMTPFYRPKSEGLAKKIDQTRPGWQILDVTLKKGIVVQPHREDGLLVFGPTKEFRLGGPRDTRIASLTGVAAPFVVYCSDRGCHAKHLVADQALGQVDPTAR